MTKYFAIVLILFLISSCSNNSGKNKVQSTDEAYVPEESEKEETTSEDHDEKMKEIDPNRGIGKFTEVEIGATLDKKMATEGLKVYELKCYSCHKLTEERVVGPGWKGVTQRRSPEWIMNFSTNTDEMLNRDPAAQAMLELCLIRMPNQNLSDEEARHVYEFMRENDGVK